MIAGCCMLLDSNIVIYAAQPAHSSLRQFISSHASTVSAVTYVEVLGFHRLSLADRRSFEAFFSAARILPIDQPVLDRAVSLRQQRRMSLGDALIAGTALVHGLTVVTHNTDDYSWIGGLSLHDPLTP